jgi:uncharacterized protein YdeI (YjbR/CyaY-like superfamily)
MKEILSIEDAHKTLQQVTDQAKQKGKFTTSEVQAIRESARVIKDTSEQIINFGNRSRKAAIELLNAVGA